MSECGECQERRECWPCKAKRLTKERDEALQTLDLERAAHRATVERLENLRHNWDASVGEAREWARLLYEVGAGGVEWEFALNGRTLPEWLREGGGGE